MPTYHTIDLRGQNLRGGFSDTLIRVIRAHLAKEGQVLVYLNRRGFAPTLLLCKSCGWQSVCSDCDAKLTLHRQPEQLICHHCNLRFAIPDVCEHCGQGELLPLGIGTQRAEEALAELFPGVPLYRIDRDTTRTNKQLNDQLERIQQGRPCIMVGTQMLAKGHHFPAVTLVAVVNADAGFLSPDFRAPERTAQLIVQVAGRGGSGRAIWRGMDPILSTTKPTPTEAYRPRLRRIRSRRVDQPNRRGPAACAAYGHAACGGLRAGHGARLPRAVQSPLRTT